MIQSGRGRAAPVLWLMLPVVVLTMGMVLFMAAVRDPAHDGRAWARSFGMLADMPGGPVSAPVRLCGAGDFIPLGQILEQSSPGGIEVAWIGGPGDDRLSALVKGSCDAVLLGYEPTGEQVAGLHDAVIAQDAIVLLVDENTYTGGVIRLDRPVARCDPLRALSMVDVRGLLADHSRPSDDGWAWAGSYDRWETYVTGAGKPIRLSKGSLLLRAWVPQTPPLGFRQAFEPGRFDTQTALHQAAGLDERVMARSWPEMTDSSLVREEEVLAVLFGDASIFAAGQGDFQFRMAYASLRAARLALAHVPVRVVAIEGVDPVARPDTIGDGRYPLRRRIHLVTHQATGTPAAELATWLQEDAGQALLAAAGYIALAPAQPEAQGATPDSSMGTRAGGR